MALWIWQVDGEGRNCCGIKGGVEDEGPEGCGFWPGCAEITAAVKWGGCFSLPFL